jgi:tungstate transport system substrate-binding protein
MKQTALKRFTLALLVFSLAVLAALPAMGAGAVRMSSTIGPIDAGIVPALVEAYNKKTGTTVTFEGAGTGATLEKAKTGNFDIVMVHARSLEDQFIADGFGVDRRDIMYNDFVILGPATDPAGITGMKSAPAALARIAIMGAPFVTRGDNSGTHVKEMEVWQAAHIKPEGDWYVTYSLGKLGNAPATAFANRRGAYILMDRATYLTLKNSIKLVPLVEKDPILLNLIAVIRVNPAKFTGLNADAAVAFADWLESEEAQLIIKEFGVKKYGEPLFFPNSKSWNAKQGK